MASRPRQPSADLWGVVSRREARLVFWLVVLALVAFIASVSAGALAPLVAPAIILFIAWLMAYVLEPPVSWLQRVLPFRGRGVAVAITYVLTAVIAFIVISSAGIALLRAAVEFVERLPEITTRVRDLLAPLVGAIDIELPSGNDVVTAVVEYLRSSGGELADAVAVAITNVVAIIAGLVTAIFISVGLAVGQVSLLGWLRRFLPARSYRDLTELERAIAVSFGGFVRGRLLIGAIFGVIVAVTAFLLGVPLAPLIGVIAGLIVFIPWIGPLIGWAVLPAFALVLAPEAVVPALVVSVIAAVAVQLLVTQLVMGAAVNMSPVAVFVVVIFGTSIAGILGAIFAIPVAAAILAVTDYLRQRDVLLRATDDDDEGSEPLAADGPPPPVPAEA